MKCEEFESLILDDVDGRLAENQKLLLRHHLAECEGCRAFLPTQMELDRTFTQSTRVELSGGFSGRILQRLDAEQASRPARMILWSDLSDLAGIVAIATAGGIAASELFPSLFAESPWIVTALLFSGSVWLISSESESPGP